MRNNNYWEVLKEEKKNGDGNWNEDAGEKSASLVCTALSFFDLSWNFKGNEKFAVRL